MPELPDPMGSNTVKRLKGTVKSWKEGREKGGRDGRREEGRKEG
jgi:hypothetical protein